MTTEKTLKNWRRAALYDIEAVKNRIKDHIDLHFKSPEEYELNEAHKNILTLSNRILKLTQELMDVKLIQK